MSPYIRISMYPFSCLYMILLIYQLIHVLPAPHIHISMGPYLNRCMCPHIQLDMCPYIHISIYPHIYTSTHPDIHTSIHPCWLHVPSFLSHLPWCALTFPCDEDMSMIITIILFIALVVLCMHVGVGTCVC